MTIARQNLGKAGEDAAAEELERRGYAILERRYRTSRGEIDIVARDGDTLVFVEVKVRDTAECGTAAEAVTRVKQRRLGRMATDYLARRNITDQPCRFDVVAIDAGVVTVYTAAFSLEAHLSVSHDESESVTSYSGGAKWSRERALKLERKCMLCCRELSDSCASGASRIRSEFLASPAIRR
jgi:putative endonuclease